MMLMADYAHRETALEIRQDDDGYSLQLRADLAELVHILIPLNLSAATLRTLAAVALKATHPPSRTGGPAGFGSL